MSDLQKLIDSGQSENLQFPKENKQNKESSVPKLQKLIDSEESDTFNIKTPQASRKNYGLTGVGTSNYDDNVAESEVHDLNTLRAYNQGIIDEFAIGLTRGLTKGALGALETLSYIADAPANIANVIEGNAITSNWLADGLNEAKDFLQEEMPIYRKNPNKTIDFSDSGFYFDMFSNAVEMATMFGLSGVGVGAVVKTVGSLIKGASNINKVAKSSWLVDKLGKGLQNGNLGRLSTATLQNFGESTLMGLENYETTYNSIYTTLIEQYKNNNEGKEPQGNDLKKIASIASAQAGEAGNNTFLLNQLFLINNYAQLGALNKAKGLIKKPSFGNFVKDQIKNAPSEAVEEGLQGITSKEVQFRAEEGIIRSESLESDTLNRLFDYATSEETLLEMAMGAISGPIQYTITQLPFQNFKEQKKSYQKQQDQLENNKKYFDNLNENFISLQEIKERYQDESSLDFEKSQKIIEDLEDEQFTNLVVNNIIAGTDSQLQSIMESELYSDETDNVVKKKIQDRLDKYSQIKSKYENFKNYGSPSEILYNELEIENNKKHKEIASVIIENARKKAKESIQPYLDIYNNGIENKVTPEEILNIIENNESTENLELLPEIYNEIINDIEDIDILKNGAKVIEKINEQKIKLQKANNLLKNKNNQTVLQSLNEIVSQNKPLASKIDDLNQLENSVNNSENKDKIPLKSKIVLEKNKLIAINESQQQIINESLGLESSIESQKEEEKNKIISSLENEEEFNAEDISSLFSKTNKEELEAIQEKENEIKNRRNEIIEKLDSEFPDDDEIFEFISELSQSEIEDLPSLFEKYEEFIANGEFEKLNIDKKQKPDIVLGNENSVIEENVSENKTKEENTTEKESTTKEDVIEEGTQLSFFETGKKETKKKNEIIETGKKEEVIEEKEDALNVLEEIELNKSKDPDIILSNEIKNRVNEKIIHDNESDVDEIRHNSNSVSVSLIKQTYNDENKKENKKELNSIKLISSDTILNEETFEYLSTPSNKNGTKVELVVNDVTKKNPLYKKLQKEGSLSESDFLTLVLQSTIDVKLVENNNISFKIFKPRKGDSKEAYELEIKLIKDVLRNEALNKKSFSFINGQYSGEYKITNKDSNITEIPNVKKDSEGNIILLYTDEYGKLTQVKNGEYDSSFDGLQINFDGTPYSGKLYVSVKKLNGVDFPLQIKIKPYTQTEGLALIEVLKSILTYDKSQNTFNKKINKKIQDLLPKRLMDYLTLDGDLPTNGQLLNLLVYNGENTKQNPVTQFYIENGTLYFGKNELNIKTFNKNLPLLYDFLKEYKKNINISVKKLREDSNYRDMLIKNGYLTTDLELEYDVSSEIERINKQKEFSQKQGYSTKPHDDRINQLNRSNKKKSIFLPKQSNISNQQERYKGGYIYINASIKTEDSKEQKEEIKASNTSSSKEIIKKEKVIEKKEVNSPLENITEKMNFKAPVKNDKNPIDLISNIRKTANDIAEKNKEIKNNCSKKSK